jgi:hypothetical protein
VVGQRSTATVAGYQQPAALLEPEPQECAPSLQSVELSGQRREPLRRGSQVLTERAELWGGGHGHAGTAHPRPVEGPAWSSSATMPA